MKKIIIAITIIILIVLLAVILVVVFLFSNQPQEPIEVQNSKSDEIVAPETKQSEKTQKDIINDYLNSSFRVLNVAFSTSSDYSLILATKRSDQANNDNCGSIYSASQCYFFTESASKYGVDAAPRFLTTFGWNGKTREVGSGGLGRRTEFIYTDGNTVEFTSTEGDAGWGVASTWHIKLDTGKVKEVRRVTTEASGIDDTFKTEVMEFE